MSNRAYMAEIEQWRAEKEEEWRGERGWLALAGLFWLDEGVNVVGCGAGCDVVLPAGPERLGEVEIEDHGIMLRIDEAAERVLVDGEKTREAELKPDISGEPTFVTVGELAFMVIQRGEAYGLRLWDKERPERQNFSGRRWFPIDERYRVRGRYERFAEPETILLQRTLGADVEVPIAGEVVFEWGGRPLKLLAQEYPPGTLFLIFKDKTSGKETYGAGRYLYAEVEKDGTVIVDFNRAYSPPCAITDFATCPLPPRGNVLPVAIRAGEIYGGEGR